MQTQRQIVDEDMEWADTDAGKAANAGDDAETSEADQSSTKENTMKKSLVSSFKRWSDMLRPGRWRVWKSSSFGKILVTVVAAGTATAIWLIILKFRPQRHSSRNVRGRAKPS